MELETVIKDILIPGSLKMINHDIIEGQLNSDFKIHIYKDKKVYILHTNGEFENEYEIENDNDINSMIENLKDYKAM